MKNGKEIHSELSERRKKMLVFSKQKVRDVINLSGKPSTNLKDFLQRFFANKVTIIALSMFFILILLAIIFVQISPFSHSDPISNHRVDIIGKVLPSSWDNGWMKIIIENDSQDAKYSQILKENYRFEVIDGVKFGYINVTKFVGKGDFILGTNSFGQDNWTRVWYGVLESIKLALFVATIEFIIGVSIGAYIGFHAGSKIDTYLMRFIDVVNGVPQLIWFILFSFILGTGFWPLSLSLISIGWMRPVYITRIYILKIKDADYIQAAKTVGASKFILIFKHAIPNILGRLLSTFVRRIPLIIFAQASLAFLGLTDASASNLGSIINDAKSNLDNWAYLLTPTIILFVLTLSLQFVANGVNDALEIKGSIK